MILLIGSILRRPMMRALRLSILWLVVPGLSSQLGKSLLVALPQDPQRVLSLDLAHLGPVSYTTHRAVNMHDQGAQMIQLDSRAVDVEGGGGVVGAVLWRRRKGLERG